MRFILSVFAAVAAFATVDAKAFTDSQYEYLFTKWVSQHNKVYAHDQFFNKFNQFKVNLDKIHKHNTGNHSYTLAMNQFGDMSATEFKAINGFRGYANEYLRSQNKPHGLKHVKLAGAVDWRQKAAVTPVKNQGQCGSCWAFSTTGSLEGQHFAKTGQLVSLSEQNLVDCSAKYGNFGCRGGLMDNAFKYIKENNGIDTESSYPYEARDDTCRFSTKTIGATDTGCKDVKQYSEDDLQDAIATVGPVSVAIDAAHTSFQLYKSGVYNEPMCSAQQLDHGVLAVGYDSVNGQDYYIVKNSWGTSWGNQGYIWMTRNKNNQCGIATLASYPTV